MDMLQPRHWIVDDSTQGALRKVSDLHVGDSVTQVVLFNAKLREAFQQLANDRAPLHGDAAFAVNRGYAEPILQGLCVTSRFSRLIGMYLPGESAIVESLVFKFRKPTYPNRPVEFRVEILRIMRALKVVRLKLTVTSAKVVCITGEAQCLLR